MFEQITKAKRGETRDRWERAAKDPAFEKLSELKLSETTAEHFLSALETGTISTNVYLRRAHNFALSVNWLLAPVLPKNQWPAVEYQEKRPITFEEHEKLVSVERNPEWKAFLQLAWHLGASQSDLANLQAEDIDWTNRLISFHRLKTRHRNTKAVMISFGESVAKILETLPKEGALFPMLQRTHEKHRAKDFKERCNRRGVSGVTLHSYRYAWAVRAREAGMPERFAMEMLGHNSSFVHRVYSKKAVARVPSLEELEGTRTLSSCH